MKPQPFCLRLLSQKIKKTKKIFNDGYLGSHTDEERSKMRYAMRIAEFRESSDPWTQLALGGSPSSMSVSVSENIIINLMWLTKESEGDSLVDSTGYLLIPLTKSLMKDVYVGLWTPHRILVTVSVISIEECSDEYEGLSFIF